MINSDNDAPQPKRQRRRILHKIRLTEISAVDRPCQEGARMTIMKRADEDDSAAVQPGSILRRSSDGVRFKVLSLRKGNPMHRPADEFKLDDPDSQADVIAKLEQKLERLESDLAQATRKAVEAMATDDEPDDEQPNAFEQTTNEIMKRDSVSRLTAMARARHEVPEAFAKYQQGNNKPASFTPPMDPRRGKAASLQFEREVSRLASERKISKTAAMSATRKENPALYQSMQDGDD